MGPIAVRCPHCTQAYSVKPTAIGKRFECQSCRKMFFAAEAQPSGDVGPLEELARDEKALDPFAGVKPPAQKPEPKRYKVLTQKDKWFSGKFDPERLEQALNAYADQGWILKAATTASINGLMGGARDEMIIILER